MTINLRTSWFGLFLVQKHHIDNQLSYSQKCCSLSIIGCQFGLLLQLLENSLGISHQINYVKNVCTFCSLDELLCEITSSNVSQIEFFENLASSIPIIQMLEIISLEFNIQLSLLFDSGDGLLLMHPLDFLFPFLQRRYYRWYQ